MSFIRKDVTEVGLLDHSQLAILAPNTVSAVVGEGLSSVADSVGQLFTSHIVCCVDNSTAVRS